MYGRYNVYTSPLTNPQRNPNVDSKRTEPLSVMEIETSKEILKLLSDKGRLMEIVDLYPELSEVSEYEESMKGIGKQIDEDLKA